MSRRMRENVAAIEKHLDLAPIVSKQIGTIHEQEEECELSDTQRTLKERNQKRMFSLQADGDSPEFPKRDSNDEVHKAQMSHKPLSLHKGKKGGLTEDDSEQQFEDYIVDFEANPFGGRNANESRQYIDDMSSSSGNPSGYSENADCLPIVEHMQDSKTTQSLPVDSMKTALRGVGGLLPALPGPGDIDDNFPQRLAGLPDSTVNNIMALHSQKQAQKEIELMYTDDQQMLPRPNRSSTSRTSQDYHSMVKEVCEREYEQMIMTDKTHKQYDCLGEDGKEVLTPRQQQELDEHTSASMVALMQEERTTERKKSGKRGVKQQRKGGGHKNDDIQLVQAAPVERSGSHRQMQLTRPTQPAPISIAERREQPLSVLLQDHRNTGSTIMDEAQSHVTVGGKTQQYETADQVVSQYQNINFMPQKNEGRDRLEILQKSREFNPVIEFDINSPFSNNQPGSSRSNSDIPLLTSNSLNLTQSQNFSNMAATGKVKPFQCKASAEPMNGLASTHQQHHPRNIQQQQQVILVQKSLDSAATQLHYRPPESTSIEILPHQALSSSGSKQSSSNMVPIKKQANSQKQIVKAQTSTVTVGGPSRATLQTTATTANNIMNNGTGQHKHHSTILTNQVESPALPPVSPVLAKSASKALQPLRSGGKTHYQTASNNNNLKQPFQTSAASGNMLAINKKMMHADQQLAFAKQQRKLQNLSASSTTVNNNNNNEPTKLQNNQNATNAANAATSAKSVSTYENRSNNTNNIVGERNGASGTYTPKAIKNKALSKQLMTLSSTINKSISMKNPASQKKTSK